MRSAFRRFARAESGASAVEFALVAMPFIGVLAMTLQTALIFWTSRNLDDSLQRAGRTIYTGEFQRANTGQTDTAALLTKVKEKMCGTSSARLATVFDCNALKLDVSSSKSFASGSVPTPLDSKTGDWSKSFGSNYSCAKPGDIVIITAALKYKVVFGFLFSGVPSFTDGSRLLQSTAVFRAEPYDTSSSKGC